MLRSLLKAYTRLDLSNDVERSVGTMVKLLLLAL